MKTALTIILLVSLSAHAKSKSFDHAAEAACYEHAMDLRDKFIDELESGAFSNKGSYYDGIALADQFEQADKSFQENNGNTCTHLKMAQKMRARLEKYRTITEEPAVVDDTVNDK